MPRPSPLLLVLLLAACGGTQRRAVESPTSEEMRVRLLRLSDEITTIAERYDALLEQNAAIEKLLERLGFRTDMATTTVQERLELMQRFDRAEVARTAAYEKLRHLLKALAAERRVDTHVEVRAGQIVVRIAERALFTPKGRLRTEAAPLLWVVADGLKAFAGRRFDVVAEARQDGVAAPRTRRRGRRARRGRRGRRDGDGAAAASWSRAASRSREVVRLLAGAGIPPATLAAMQRRAEPTPGKAYLEIIVRPTGEELPRIRGVASPVAAEAPRASDPTQPPERAASPALRATPKPATAKPTTRKGRRRAAARPGTRRLTAKELAARLRGATPKPATAKPTTRKGRRRGGAAAKPGTRRMTAEEFAARLRGITPKAPTPRKAKAVKAKPARPAKAKPATPVKVKPARPAKATRARPAKAKPATPKPAKPAKAATPKPATPKPATPKPATPATPKPAKAAKARRARPAKPGPPDLPAKPMRPSEGP